MKLTYIIVLIFSINYLLISCDFNKKAVDRDRTCSLTIVIDSSINSNSYYGFMYLVMGSDSIDYDTLIWDKKLKEQTYKWDSLKIGNYQCRLKSVYHHPRVVAITLKADTIIKIHNNFTYKFVNLIPQKNLFQTDTIDFAFESNGCYFTIRKYQLIKLDNQYTLTRNSEYGRDSIRKVVSSDIIKDLYDMQKVCRNNKNKTPRGFRTFQYILIAGQKAFYYDDNYTMGPSYYEPFLNKYDRKQN